MKLSLLTAFSLVFSLTSFAASKLEDSATLGACGGSVELRSHVVDGQKKLSLQFLEVTSCSNITFSSGATFKLTNQNGVFKNKNITLSREAEKAAMSNGLTVNIASNSGKTKIKVIVTAQPTAAAGAATLEQALLDLKTMKQTHIVSKRLLKFVQRFEHNTNQTDLKTSIGWILCSATRTATECYSGANNTLDHSIGLGLCMASGRVRTDCFSGLNDLDESAGWGLCMAANRKRLECFNGSVYNESDKTIEWGVCMASGRSQPACLLETL